MNQIDAVAVLMRWVHIFSATMAVGVPVFMRFVLMPAANEALTPALHGQLRERIAGRWRFWLYALIVLFLVSGLYQFLGVARWKRMDEHYKGIYHMLFGIHFLSALCIFFIASALAGRTKALTVMRANMKLWLNVNVALAVVMIMTAGVMRYLPEGQPVVRGVY